HIAEDLRHGREPLLESTEDDGDAGLLFLDRAERLGGPFDLLGGELHLLGQDSRLGSREEDVLPEPNDESANRGDDERVDRDGSLGEKRAAVRYVLSHGFSSLHLGRLWTESQGNRRGKRGPGGHPPGPGVRRGESGED